MSPVSGAILCYDAERRDTLRGLSEALREFDFSTAECSHGLTTSLDQLCPALPMVLFACKSDPDKTLEVDAQVGDSIGQPYNVGLIEVTTATPQGKHKMRTGLRWLLYRLEERQSEGCLTMNHAVSAYTFQDENNVITTGGTPPHRPKHPKLTARLLPQLLPQLH